MPRAPSRTQGSAAIAGVSLGRGPGTLVVGDVHGCADELERLVRDVSPERVVLVGDLYTKGPDPEGVWAQIRDGGWSSVLGNHDDRLLRAMEDPTREDVTARQTIARLDSADPAWAAALRALPLFLDTDGFTVVHAGLAPDGDLGHTTRRMALLLRRWPDDVNPANPFWHQVYQGPRRVIFGHDAVRGLVRVERAGLPWLIGLDTGCVYGGKLSGYLIDSDTVVQVPARRTYKRP